MELTKKQQEHIIHSINQAVMDGKVVHVGSREVCGALLYGGNMIFIRPNESNPKRVRIVVFSGIENCVTRAWSPDRVGETIIYAPPVTREDEGIVVVEEDMMPGGFL